ncbi:MAG: type II toxin-antitoxin system HicA family toxin [Chloroflexi bacterium]|nr:type II toxin-antitoxin system HicA family toxin [Chloroflexota bacterium]
MTWLQERQLERAFSRAGWYLHHSRGSHFYYRHPRYPGRQITVPVHPGEAIPVKTLKSILEQSDMTLEQLEEYL